ncbi:MAG: FHA domain-containing protein [Planctomycetota bacterium]
MRSWIIGSGDDADLRIDDPTISRQHCRLTRVADEFFIEDLNSTNGVFVGKHRIAKKTKLVAGVAVTLAESVTMPWPFESTAKRILRVGRHPDNDLRIADASVSSHHAVLMQDKQDQWTVRDLNSTNQTFIGDHSTPVKTARALRQQNITFGHKSQTLEAWLGQVEPWIGVVGHDGLPVKRVASSNTTNDTSPPTTVRGSSVASREPRPNAHASIDQLSQRPGRWQSMPPWPRRLIFASIAGLALLGLIQAVLWEPSRPSIATDVNGSFPTEKSIKANTKNATQQATVELPPARLNETLLTKTKATNLPPAVPTKIKLTDRELLEERIVWIALRREDTWLRFGHGVAVSPTRIITSGRLVAEMKATEGFDQAEVIHLKSGTTSVIKEMDLNLQWKNAQRDAIQVKAKLKAAVEANDLPGRQSLLPLLVGCQLLRRAVDLGIIEIASPFTDDDACLQRLAEVPVEMSSKVPRIQSKLNCVGDFFGAEDAYLGTDEFDPSSTNAKSVSSLPSMSVRYLVPLPKINPTMPRMHLCGIKSPAADPLIFRGCPIFDSAGRWVGIVSRSDTMESMGTGIQQFDDTVRKATNDGLTIDVITADAIESTIKNPSMSGDVL